MRMLLSVISIVMTIAEMQIIAIFIGPITGAGSSSSDDVQFVMLQLVSIVVIGINCDVIVVSEFIIFFVVLVWGTECCFKFFRVMKETFILFLVL